MTLRTATRPAWKLRKRQAKSRREKNFLSSIIDSSEDAILAKDLNGVIRMWNQGAERLYGYTPAEIIGRPVTTLVPLDRQAEIASILERLKRGERVEHFETVRRRKDGSLVDISLTVSPIKDEYGNVVAASSIARDITDKKRSEALIHAQLTEKSVLLQEIYHRVKNNLQLICSLLDLRWREMKGSNPDTAFKESIDRIRAMALVHEKMLQSGEYTTIDLMSYITELFEPLREAYLGNDKRIQLKMTGDSCLVALDVAVPLGLIFNELITNALKYAFPNGNSGEIQIDILNCEDLATIIFSDNGVGFGGEIDFSSVQTFGLRIVRLLTSQLRGSIEASSSTGTTYTIRVPLNGEVP
jgi:PAS domain S-box-containing protein